ncbi:serine/threonine protein kinase [bacterium]|nr:MAG: serine/threonine protein kinase [bacterium]
MAGGLAALAAGVLLALGAWAVALFKKKRARGPADLAAAMAGGGPPKEGDVLAGKYRLAGFVGRDAAGERWEAVDAALNRTVSVRRLDPGDDPQARERMRQESRTAAGLQHPNIVAVFEALDLPNGVFLVMEHVPGRSVAEMLATGGPLPLGRVRRILEAAAAALVYARAQGVVHPGLKPSSLVVTDGGAVKVRDFASAAGGLGGDDLRALGECLYEMLTGEPLDAGAGRFAQGSRWPSQVRPGVPPAADALVLGAISADPGERFGGVAEFVEGLSALGPPES